MRSIKMRLGLAAALTLAATASAASAHEFSYTGTVPTPLLASAVTNQKFTAGFGTVTCTLLEFANTKIESLSFTSHWSADVLYKMCTSKTVLGSEPKVKEPILALYNFLANNEEVRVEEEVKFELEGLCTIKVTKQPLKGINYDNVGSMLNVLANVSNISWTSEGGGGICGSGSAGTYTGTTLVEGDGGGVLSWS